jgi:hypothetical protein
MYALALCIRFQSVMHMKMLKGGLHAFQLVVSTVSYPYQSLQHTDCHKEHSYARLTAIESGVLLSFPAGILSSFGELSHMAEGRAQLESLNPFRPQPKMSYKDGFQQRSVVLGLCRDQALHTACFGQPRTTKDVGHTTCNHWFCSNGLKEPL